MKKLFRYLLFKEKPEPGKSQKDFEKLVKAIQELKLIIIKEFKIDKVVEWLNNRLIWLRNKFRRK